MVVAPLAAMLGQMAISRTREYSADRRGAEICGNPIWLASALGKIAGAAQVIHNDDAERNPATAHMFIINPLSGERMDNLFSTHPNTENRITALHQMAGEFAAGGRSEEHTSELQSLMRISYAVFCLKKKKNHTHNSTTTQPNTQKKSSN